MGEFNELLGPVVIGTLFNTYLFGLAMFQYASYANTSFGDGTWIKCVVGALFSIDAFHSILGIFLVWEYCVTNYTNPQVFHWFMWAYSFTPICVAVSGVVTQTFLAQRAFQLNKHRTVFAALLVGSAATCALGLASGALAISDRMSMLVMLSRPPTYCALIVGWLSLQCVTNLVISVSLSFNIYKTKAIFRSDDSRLNRVLRTLLQTGAFVFLISALNLIGFAATSRVNLFATFVIPIGRVYSTTILDILLCRNILVDTTNDVALQLSKSTHPEIWPGISAHSSPPTASFNLHNIHVKTEIFSDGNPTSDDSRSPSLVEEEKGGLDNAVIHAA